MSLQGVGVLWQDIGKIEWKDDRQIDKQSIEFWFFWNCEMAEIIIYAKSTLIPIIASLQFGILMMSWRFSFDFSMREAVVGICSLSGGKRFSYWKWKWNDLTFFRCTFSHFHFSCFLSLPSFVPRLILQQILLILDYSLSLASQTKFPFESVTVHLISLHFHSNWNKRKFSTGCPFSLLFCLLLLLCHHCCPLGISQSWAEWQ